MKKGLLALGSGILFALPIIYPRIGFLQWVFLIPFAMFCLWNENEKISLKREYFFGFFFFFGYYIVSYSWLISMYPLSVTGISKVAALAIVILASIGIPMFQALGFGLFFPLVRCFQRKGMPKWLLPIFAGAVWCVFEWGQNFFWFGLPWVRIALGQTQAAELYRSVNLFGSSFIAFLVVAVNFYLALSIKEAEKRKKAALAVTALVFFTANALYGIVDLENERSTDYETISVSAFQGNISTEEKWSPYMLDLSFEIYERLAKEASEAGADYAILPETVFPYVIEDHPDIDLALKDISWHYGVTLMVGTFGKNDDGVGNVIRVYEPMRDGVNVYTKQKPVPFGEYVPMKSLIMTVFPALGEINMLNRSLSPGSFSSVWESDDGIFGYLICFDSIYSSLARESVKNGAELLLISTNDSWFGVSVGTKMHLLHGKLRAVENGRSVVRAANTGISAVIAPNGEIKEMLGVFEEGQISWDVPISDNLTVYTRIGDVFIYICLLFMFVCTIKMLWEEFNGKKAF